MTPWADILKKAALRARAGERVQLPTLTLRDRVSAHEEAKQYPDLELLYDRYLGVLVFRKINFDNI